MKTNNYKTYLSLNTHPFVQVNFFSKYEVDWNKSLVSPEQFYFNDPTTPLDGLGPFLTLQEAIEAYLLRQKQDKGDKEAQIAPIIRVDFQRKKRLHKEIS
jgi:hypothetical protein